MAGVQQMRLEVVRSSRLNLRCIRARTARSARLSESRGDEALNWPHQNRAVEYHVFGKQHVT